MRERACLSTSPQSRSASSLARTVGHLTRTNACRTFGSDFRCRLRRWSPAVLRRRLFLCSPSPVGPILLFEACRISKEIQLATTAYRFCARGRRHRHWKVARWQAVPNLKCWIHGVEIIWPEVQSVLLRVQKGRRLRCDLGPVGNSLPQPLRMGDRNAGPRKTGSLVADRGAVRSTMQYRRFARMRYAYRSVKSRLLDNVPLPGI